ILSSVWGPGPLSGWRLERRRVAPPSLVRDDAVRLGRPPRPWLILMDRRHGAQDRVHHAPRRLHVVLTCEERRVAPESVAEQPLVRRHLVARVVPGDQLHLLTDHGFARLFGPRVECN